MAHREVIFQPGTLFHGRYRIVRCLKEGGMGAVYEVMDEKTSGSRALKVMLPNLLENEGLRARFALEARITGGIESDHIVRTFDAGVDETTGTPFLVMDLLRGEDLGGLLKRRKLLPALEVAIYLFQTARALDKTHAASIIHRDLKPDNLFLTFRDDGSPCVKILDFGIAKVTALADPSIKTRPMMGTPLYMSPEQVRNERTIGPAADIYALGHIAYTLLVGESYWAEEAENIPSPFLLISEIMRGVTEPATERARRRRNVTLPAAFDPWFKEATAIAAEHRFDRATEAIELLADALSVPLPRTVQPSFEMSATNPVGEDPSIHGGRTTADLHLAASMEAADGPPGINTPTALTTHSRLRSDPAVIVTNPNETGVTRKRRDPEIPLTTGIVDGPASEPTSSASPRQLAHESAQTLAATGETGRAPAQGREKPPPVIPVYDRSVSKTVGRDRSPPTESRERPAPPIVARDRAVPPTVTRDRAVPPTVTRDRAVPPTVTRDRAVPPTVTRERATSTPTPSREPTPPPTGPLDKPSLFSGVRDPTPPFSPLRDPTPIAKPTSGRGATLSSKLSPSLREGGAMKKDPPAAFRFQIAADLHRSILRLKVWGFWTLDEGKAYWEEFRLKARPLIGQPWYVLADIADFPPQKDEVREFLEKPMIFARQNGMVRAANLVGSALPKMAIARMSAEMGLPAFSFFNSEAEATAWLLQG
jgi:serine/threonine protein kinase